MIDVQLPRGPAPLVVRSTAACLAAVLQLPLRQVPVPEQATAAPGAWRSWLAGVGLGLVEVARPQTFSWPGYWIAVVGGADERAVLAFGTPSGVVASPADEELLGRATADLDVQRGWVVAPLEVPQPARPLRQPVGGRVELVAVAAQAGAPMRVVDATRAWAGKGLDGDRYAAAAGTFTPTNAAAAAGGGYDLTLVAAEVLEALVLPEGRRLAPQDARRNVVTRGVDLDHLLGRRFRIGDVECLGRRRCEPCSHLEALTAPGALRGMVHQGGLRADILTDGQVTIGAPIIALD